MQLNQLLKVEQQKQQLTKKRQHLIKQQIKKRNTKKVNMQQSAVKKGYIQKSKIIQKKQFDTIVQKSKKAKIMLQDNVTVNTFLTNSNNFNKILTRTTQYLKFNIEKVREGLRAISAYGLANNENALDIMLTFQKQIDCEPHPFLFDLEYPQKVKKTIIITPHEIKQNQQLPFSKIVSFPVEVMSSHDFIDKYRNDNIFRKHIFNQQYKCLVCFKLYKLKKFYKQIIKKGMVVFPIDLQKIPFALQSKLSSYEHYILHMTNKHFCSTKQGLQHHIHLKISPLPELLQNTLTSIIHTTSKLIQRSKNKNNKLVKIGVKTGTSILIDVYENNQ